MAAYLELYRKYQDDYGIEEILKGRVSAQIYARIYEAAFDERISVTNLLLDGVNRRFLRAQKEKHETDLWYEFLKEFRAGIETVEDAGMFYESLLAEREAALAREQKEGFLSEKEAVEKRNFSHKSGNFLLAASRLRRAQRSVFLRQNADLTRSRWR